jgi:hypothetical protein
LASGARKQEVELTEDLPPWRKDIELARIIALKSGLPGTFKDDGPGDALRHMLGTGLLLDTYKHSFTFKYFLVFFGTVLLEVGAYSKSVKEDGVATARGRFYMDFRNNMLALMTWVRVGGNLRRFTQATIEIVGHGPDESFVEWQKTGFGERGPIRVTQSGTTSGSTRGAARASWFSSPSNDIGRDKQEWKDLVMEGMRGRIESSEERDGTTVWPVDQDDNDQQRPEDETVVDFPTNVEQLRQLLLAMGLAPPPEEWFDRLLSDLPKEVKIAEMAKRLTRSDLLSAVWLALANPDTPDVARAALIEWLRETMPGRLNEALSRGEISDPPKELRELLDKIKDRP